MGAVDGGGVEQVLPEDVVAKLKAIMARRPARYAGLELADYVVQVLRNHIDDEEVIEKSRDEPLPLAGSPRPIKMSEAAAQVYFEMFPEDRPRQ